MAQSKAIMVERIEDAVRFGRLREEWNELLEASASDCLFLTWEWLHTWWKHLAESRTLSILAVRCDGKLVAIAPLAVRSRKLTQLLPFPLLQFLGTGSVGSNYLDLIVRPGKEQESLQAVAEYLEKRGLMLDLAEMKRNVSSAAKLAAELGQRDWSSSESKINICPFINLSGHTWESYLAMVGPEHFRRNLKSLMKHFDVRFEQARSEEERCKVLPALLALHNMRWKDRGGSEAFHTPALCSFHEELSRLALERGWLRLFTLLLDGKLAAALYGFRYRDTLYFYQSGFDPAYRKHSLGFITVGLSIKSAIEEGAAEYDFLGGDEPYKFRWARGARELSRLELYPPGPRGLLYRRTLGLTRRLRRVARQVLPRAIVRRMAGGRRTVVWKEPYAAAPN